MVKNRAFLSLTLSFGIINGVFNVYGSVMDDILDPYGFHPNQVSTFGTAMMIIGTIGAVISGAYVERTLRYRNVFWFCGLVGILLSIAFPLALVFLHDASKFYWIFFFLVSFQGLIYIPAQPMTIDYGIDTMFPVG